MSRGPLQILIVNFEESNFTGEIQAELERLERENLLHVLDLLFVAKSPEGELTVLDADEQDIWYAADAIEPGSAAGVIVVEHTWASGLRDATERAGGRATAAEWVDEDASRRARRHAFLASEKRGARRAAIIAPPVVATTRTPAIATSQVSRAKPIPITPNCCAEDASACGIQITV